MNKINVFMVGMYGRRRFIIAYNPEQAKYYKQVRKRNLEQIQIELDAFEKYTDKKKERMNHELLSHRSTG